MAKVIAEGMRRFNHQYPRTAAMVTARADGKKNVMAVAWHSPVSFKPPLYGIAVHTERFTYQLIADSKEFGVNFVPMEAAELVAAVGGSGGTHVDKFQHFNIAEESPVKTSVPILEAAYAAYECKLVDDRVYGSHRWLVGEVVAVHVLEEAFTAEAVLDLNQVSPALFLGREYYVTADKNSLRHLDREVYGRR